MEPRGDGPPGPTARSGGYVVYQRPAVAALLALLRDEGHSCRGPHGFFLISD